MKLLGGKISLLPPLRQRTADEAIAFKPFGQGIYKKHRTGRPIWVLSGKNKEIGVKLE
jgi:hypothetical protein